MKTVSRIHTLSLFRAWAFVILSSCALRHSSCAAPRPAGEVFGHQVLPILQAKCFKCHGEEGKTKGGLDLTTLANVMKGGENGASVVPGKSRESPVWQQISENEMPPEGKGERVTYEELQVISQWIESSAFPDAQALAAQATSAVHERAKSLWSFQPMQRPALPKVQDKSRVSTPVDRFTLAKLEANGGTLSPQANPRTLVRRVYFDLLGLPPTPEEVEAFVADSIRNPQSAIRNLIERLLASPHYGERWGRHWLDVAGWSESALHLADADRPGFWRYRDWVIAAFNDDKPYDAFVREQLAGDELTPWRDADRFDEDTIGKLTATGFLRCTPDATDNQFITQEDKVFTTQQSVVEVATKALLGLTLNCVRCHDHKYDPITQEDYYSLIALFQPAYDPARWLPGTLDKYAPGPVRVIPLTDRAGREKFEQRLADLRRQNAEFGDHKHLVLPAKYRDRYLREHLAELPASFDRTALEEALALEESKRAPEQSVAVGVAFKHFGIELSQLATIFPEMKVEMKKLQARGDDLNQQGLQIGEVLWALWDVSTTPSPTRLLTRGDFKNPAREIAPGILQALDIPTAPWRAPLPDAARQTTGRRLALADWLTHPQHPLTARVMVNRVWQRHFGTGLVATPDDFGTRGAKPTHPELLDWLASEFAASGWRVKHLHRLILNSATWRQRSGDLQSPTAVENRHSLLPAFPRRRLEAEAVRDAMLHVSGLLDGQRGGESVDTVRLDDGSYDVSPKEPGRYRRTVYLSTRRTAVPTLLMLFDAPQMDTNWPERHDSAIAPQSLALMNHPFVLECADAFASRILRESKKPAQRVEHAYALAYNRAPAAEERELFAPLLSASTTAEQDTWRTLAHALLASSEFLYVD